MKQDKEKNISNENISSDEKLGGTPSKLKSFFTYFEKVGSLSWDFFGIFCIAISAISLIGLLGLTKGSLITPWSLFLKKWFGAGSFIAIFILGLIGILSLRKKFLVDSVKWIWKIILFEGILFSLTTLFSLSGGRSLERAENGLDGGLIGWGIAEIVHKILPDVLSILFLSIFCLFLVIISFELKGHVKNIYNYGLNWLKTRDIIPNHINSVDENLNIKETDKFNNVNATEVTDRTQKTGDIL